MRPKTDDNARPSAVPSQHASVSSKLVKRPLDIGRGRSKIPVFSDVSSPTEYTSSSVEDDVHETGNCVESKPEVTKPIQASTSVALSSICDSKTEKVAASQKQGSPLRISLDKDETVLDEQTPAAQPSTGIPRVGIKSTPLKERRELKDGKTIVVVDLDDSDEETDAPLTETSPLCIKCLLEHEQQHKQPEPKAADNEEVHTPKVTLVVDLSGTALQGNHAHIPVGERAMCQTDGTPLMTPVSSKGDAPENFSREPKKTVSVNNWKHVDSEMDLGREHLKTAPSKSNGKQVMDFKDAALKACGRQIETVVEFSKEQMKTVSNGKRKEMEVSRERVKSVMESSSKPRVGFSPKSLRASTEKLREAVFSAGEESEDEASTLSEDYRRGLADGQHVEMIRPDWSADVLCDLCERGPSLSLGAWYSWCCGNPSLICTCPFEDQQRKKRNLKSKGGKSWKSTDPPYPWSGKVHKLCGLWSAEVFEDANQPWRIMKLWTAVQRSRKSKCSDPDCGLFGATLGCRVASCKKNFHYPCADKLSVLVKVRMWDGLMKPIACKYHRNVDDVLDDVKLQKDKSIFTRKRKRLIKKVLIASPEAGSSKLDVRISCGVEYINIESSGEEDSPRQPPALEVTPRLDTPTNIFSSRLPFTRIDGTSDSLPKARTSVPEALGKNLLCSDFSGGQEPIVVPCTNDVDDDPPPYLEYITKSRYKGNPLDSRNHSHPLFERQAKACDGCALHDPDDPFAPLSVHIPFERREDDFREDWLRERMYGRLPYDKYARLVIGTDYNELVECNDRCKCGDSCINREMQKGLRTPIELYKTENKGWAVRTLVPVPRGQFVIEYVGEMLTQDQAQKFGQIYDEIKRSYLYDLDYPESKRTPDFTLDGFHASNVARFINHSCDANLKIYRVYVDTTYKWLSHIGMYAIRDIEAGEELSYDYNYGRHDLQVHDGHSHHPDAGKQKADLGNDSRHIMCHCGAKNCREWLWRPMHTGEESEEE